jgi:lysozyme family protein
MQHPFTQLEPHYAAQIAAMAINPNRIRELDEACDTLLEQRAAYQALSNATSHGTPVAFLMAIAYREMSGNTHCFLGNGQSLSRRTTIVPKGLGPWLQPYPQNFVAGGLMALHIDGVDAVVMNGLPIAAYESEALNGFGYMNRGLPSPYVFGGTNIQKPGKYVADGEFDSSEMDSQLGTLAIMERLFQRDASLKFGDTIVKTPNVEPPAVPATPLGLGGGINVFILQQKLNALHVNGTPLQVDGNFGKATKRAVKSFQYTHHLTVDGLVGPQTIKALNA